VLSIENEKISRDPVLNGGLNDTYIRKIDFKKGIFFFLHRSGLELFDTKDQSWSSLGTLEGIVSSTVNDFAVIGDSICIISEGLPILLNYKEIKSDFGKIDLIFEQLLLGSKDIRDENKLNFRENDLKVAFEFRGILFARECKLKIQLNKNGNKGEWEDFPVYLGKYQKLDLNPGIYQLNFQVVYRGQVFIEKSFSFEITPPFWNELWFQISILLGVVLIIALAYKIRLNITTKRSKLESEIARSRLTAIQSQMNPHFIFNALNSIQDQVLHGEKINSYSYISKFADLVRKTLEYSDKDLITLDQEIKLIEIYLTLEKLRFDEKLEYEINFEDIEGTLIPPMILQPFIENAIVHGLLHKEGKGKLKINISKTHSDTLECLIEDNGIGRKKSKEIQDRKMKDHTSFSTGATERRLQILSQRYNKEFKFFYTDLEENGASIGTRLTIQIPLLQKF
ncbi:MAG: histidine kinase, partial [Crocinitomicaceae bacterium]